MDGAGERCDAPIALEVGVAPILPATASDLSQESNSLAMQLQDAITMGGSLDQQMVVSYPSPSHSGSSTPSASNSPSSSASSPCTPPRQSLGANVEKENLLDDLGNFIPVGVLKRKDTAVDGQMFDTGDSSRLVYPSNEVLRLEGSQWIRTSVCSNNNFPGWSAVRVYVLPDDIGRAHISRTNLGLRRCLKLVMSRLDPSPEAWEGNFDPAAQSAVRADEEGESLFYIFNTLESPNPDVEAVSDPYSRAAMEEVLWKEGNYVEGDDMGVIGLKTPLYPYQRRSAAHMIQRESEPRQTLDPRLQTLRGPTGKEYYFDKEGGTIYGEKRLYSEACGGILAETMGYGKTLVCLAVILATRGHFPRIPSMHMEGLHPVRPRTGSLLEMAAAAAGRFSLPWKSYLDGKDNCLAACEANRGSYTITKPPPKYKSRATAAPKFDDEKLKLCSATLIIVPSNLVDHWLNEIRKHTQGLNVLVFRDSAQKTPQPDELLDYDIILFSRPRFDKEAGPNPAATSARYETPLKRLHWLRVIVDEGHNFASQGGKSLAVFTLEKLHVERRWVVSGTPSGGLYGIEVALASQETTGSAVGKQENSASSVLEARKKAANVMDEELKNIDKLRNIVVDFLALKPWSNAGNDDPANWSKYTKPLGPDGKRRTSPSLRSTLQSLVVRHRAEDINKDLVLPKLHNKVVYLEPTFYDKLSLNLFIITLTVNAITSERTDEDYMFHPKNRKHLSVLISNLRHAGFWWAGFEKKELQSSVDVARKYIVNNNHRMPGRDLRLLCEAIDMAEKALKCGSWNAFGQFAELGVFLQDFPENARDAWAIDALDEHRQPLLLGISQARHVQKFVTSHLSAYDPSEGIIGAGIKQRSQMRAWADKAASKQDDAVVGATKKSNDNLVHRPKPEKENAHSKKSFSLGRVKSLPADSPLKQTKFVATASAKLTYLLDKVQEFQEKEKIIIFYESNNTGFWIAEGLELLGVEFRIYANTLTTKKRSEYLNLFNETETVRVLLMDLRQASHGLHIACASRVFIVNPIWDPNVESQAIKRAHRISQTKPVYVETLVLRDTLEDKMLKRRKQMTNAELQHAEKDLLDDNTMSYIIQNQRFLPVFEDEASARPAYFKTPVGFFDRHTLPIPDNYQVPSLPITYVSPTKSPVQPVPFRPMTPSKKRRATEDLPWIQSDIEGSPRLRPALPKRRRSNTEVINGIVMITPKPRTPPSRRVSASPIALNNAQNGSPRPSGSRAFPAMYDGQTDGVEDFPVEEEMDVQNHLPGPSGSQALPAMYDGQSNLVEDFPVEEEMGDNPPLSLFDDLSPLGIGFFRPGESFGP
ncbi:hypothetical protein FQN55_005594 [Onygenales sp. PD_40]|nr:hypothetical protein FQN55_005594 [Onygenales sp. PD_40]KAK2789797.1 hypothetical protein FQN52_005923 [Onygenales sp. PD_12]